MEQDKTEAAKARRTQTEAEIAVLRRIEQKLEGTDTHVFLSNKPEGPTTLEGVVDGKGFRHTGSIVVGLAKLLNLLEEP